jgi:hypothetical protein
MHHDQSYSDGGEQLPPRKAELEALRRFPFSLVARVTRELFVLGFLRQANNCGSTKCKEAKSACKHTKVGGHSVCSKVVLRI